VELILAACAMRDGVVPPTATVRRDDVEFPAIDLVAGGDGETGRPHAIAHTLNVSLGFGGANAAVVLASADAPVSIPARNAPAAPAVPARAVHVTGIGLLVPGCGNADEWAARWARMPGAPATPDLDYDAIEASISARRVRRMSPCVKLLLAVAQQAVGDAALPASALDEDMHAVLGSTHLSPAYTRQYYEPLIADGLDAGNPMLFAEGVPNAASAQLSLMLGLKGATHTIIGSRTAGLDALALAALRIRAGMWERAIVGATEEHDDLVDDIYRHFGLLARDAAVPFGREAGFRTGPGAVAFVLESDAHRQARGARSFGTIGAGAAALVDPCRPRRAAGTLSALLDAAGAGARGGLVACASGSRLDRVEAHYLRRAARPGGVGLVHAHLAETFSVSPLAAIAGVLRSGRLPATPVPPSAWAADLRWAAEDDAPVGRVGILAHDPSGAMRVQRIDVDSAVAGG
jgi:3-oxoacyl-(acyl-carrier-protein) synthase